MILKSGTNTFHGALYEYYRDEKLNANTFDANRGGQQKAGLYWNQPGATVDGPVKIPGLYDQVAKTTGKQAKRIRKLAFDEKQFKRDGGLVKGVRLAGEQKYSVYERLWTRPSLTGPRSLMRTSTVSPVFLFVTRTILL